LTDFGTEDHYVSAMKGVILSINPAVKIVDITHGVQPQQIRQGGYLLWSVSRYFPHGTIFMNVIDPGVGSKRRIVCLRSRRSTFLAPDNGLLDFIQTEEKIVEAVEVKEAAARKYLPSEISATFHGRDIFAPLTAHISTGVPIKKLGDIFVPPSPASPFVRSRSDLVHPCILHIDHFGNIITNIRTGELHEKDLQAVSIGRNLVSRWIQYYEEAPDKTPCLLVGSAGLIEVSVKYDSAARLLNATLDTPMKIYWR